MVRPRPPSPWLQGAALTLLVALAHGLSLRSGFIVDDFPLIVHSPVVTEGGHWREIFTGDYFRNPAKAVLWRPVAVASFALNWALCGPRAAAFHAANVALHGLNALLVWRLVLALTALPGAAFAAAALFAIHPLHTEAVGAVFARTELLAALGQLLALLCWLRGRESARWPLWMAGSIAALALALLAKESAVMMPGLILAEGLIRRRPWREVARWTAAGGLTVVVYLAVRWRLFGVIAANPVRPEVFALINPTAGLPWPQRALVGLSLLPRALGKFLWPRTLTLDYSLAEIPVDLTVSVLLLATAGLTLLAAALREVLLPPRLAAWPEPLRLAAAWFVIPWLLVGNILWPVSTIFAERLLYFPSVALCLGAGWLAHWLWLRGQTALLASVAALVAVLAIGRSNLHHLDLRDQRTAILATAEASPRSARAQADAAGVLLTLAQETGDPAPLREAADRARAAVEIHPPLVVGWLNLASAQMALRQWGPARAAALEALRLSRPGDPERAAAEQLWAALERRTPSAAQPQGSTGL